MFVSKRCATSLQEDSIWTGKPVGATGPYGMAKRLLHEACETYGRQYDLPCVVLVPANLYGPEDHFEEEKSHVIPAIIRRYVEAEAAGLDSVVNWGTGSPTREFLHVADAAEAIAIAAEKMWSAFQLILVLALRHRLQI